MAAGEIRVLGLETSCDETAAAVVCRGANGQGAILSNIVRSQLEDHAQYGGVVPEIAARAHSAHLDRIVGIALSEADVGVDGLDGVAGTAGPGLLGGLIVGLTMAKGIALSRGLPFLAINHLEGHALTPRLLEPCPFPYVLLLVSGGHTQLQLVRGVGDYERLGSTIDDALGEAFDKTAKLLGLGYPGGAQVEIQARSGNALRFDFPHPLKGRPDCNFSFSGLKTAVREVVHRLGTLTEQDVADVCAGFQRAVAVTVADRAKRAFAIFRERYSVMEAPAFVVAGGVAANVALCAALQQVATDHGFILRVPPFDLCTDNAAMIAWAAAERLGLGMCDDLNAVARARWPLDPVAGALYGHGKSGAKV